MLSLDPVGFAAYDGKPVIGWRRPLSHQGESIKRSDFRRFRKGALAILQRKMR